MDLIVTLQSIWIFLIIALSIYKLKWGVSAYLAYLFLVPYMNLNLFGLNLQWNLFNFFMLVLMLVQWNSKNHDISLDWKPLAPFVVYFAISLLMILFQDGMPYAAQFTAWRLALMKTLIMPYVIWNTCRMDPTATKLFRNTTIVCIIIAAAYGLFLTTMPGINPYTMALGELNNVEFKDDYIAAIEGGRMFGRITSVFVHPMQFGLFLGLSFVFVFSQKDSLNKIIFYSMFAIIGVDCIVCGVRSVLAGLAIAIVFYFMFSRNFKYMVFAAIIGIIGMQIIEQIPELSLYIESFTSKSSSTIVGSSLDMRLDQLQGCFREIADSFVFGKGFGWTQYYMSLHESHPIMLAFESLIFVVLCNSGLVGVILWIYMTLSIMKYNIVATTQNNASILNALMFFYLGYSSITGEYGYMQYFVIFYVLILSALKNEKDEYYQ